MAKEEAEGNKWLRQVVFQQVLREEYQQKMEVKNG